MVPLDEQEKQLGSRKEAVLATLEDLENHAKKEGIEPV